MPSSKPDTELEYLLKLRLVVARFGEMDYAMWWNTQSMLGQLGKMALSRGLPKTHLFAQARVVFSVARSRCAEVFDPPGCMTLWHLPADIEDEFETQWQSWLDDIDTWVPFFEALETRRGDDLLQLLEKLTLVSSTQSETVRNLRRSAEGRAVQLPGMRSPDVDTFALLAAGFSKGEPGNPVVPYARLEHTA